MTMRHLSKATMAQSLHYKPMLQQNMFESELARHMKQGMLYSYNAWDINLD
jgi:hypothetical protein